MLNSLQKALVDSALAPKPKELTREDLIAQYLKAVENAEARAKEDGHVHFVFFPVEGVYSTSLTAEEKALRLKHGLNNVRVSWGQMNLVNPDAYNIFDHIKI